MKPFSSSQRLRRTILIAIVCAFAVFLIGLGIWKYKYSPKDNYRDMVNAFYTGAIALEVGDLGHALPSLLQATQLNASEPAAWADLGLCYLRDNNNYQEADKALKKAEDLAPQNGQIAAIVGQSEGGQFHFPEAIAAYQKALSINPNDLRARYSLTQILYEQAGPRAEAEMLKQYQIIYQTVPDNLFAATTLATAAAKAGKADLPRRIVARLAIHSSAWPVAVQQAFHDAQKALSQSDIRAAVSPLQRLQNLMRGNQNDADAESARAADRAADTLYQTYQDDILTVAGDAKKPGTPITRFLVLTTPPATPAAPDIALRFTPQSFTGSATGPWSWAQSHFLTSNGSPGLLTANGREVRAGNAALPFPGGPQATPPALEGVVVFDMNNDADKRADPNADIPMDIACAGAGGLRLYRQGKSGTFADVTAQAKLPPAIVSRAYTGIWANDTESDGNLDLILGSVSGPPTVLRNNGDGTWAVLNPFGPAKSGLRQWAWADLDGDGLPDAAFLDSYGRLNIFENKRSGAFGAWTIPTDLGKVAALSAADPDRDGTQDLVVLMANGSIRQLSRHEDGNGWNIAELGRTSAPSTDGSTRLRWADLDNNGALDLIVTSSQGSQVFLSDAHGKFIPLATPVAARNIGVDAQTIKGRLDLIGLDAQGHAVRLVNTGSKDYGWQDVRLRGGCVDGDRRNNAFGIGGEISLRAGLLYETQIINGLVTHFGLGDYPRANYVRNLWPDGKPQGEFTLQSRNLTKIEDLTLKGSCPWLFADDGTGASTDQGMKFITDLIWRSPLGLRINAQDTAGVVQTRDWVKVRGDQLKARDGFYNLRITADLWETHFFDEVKLMTVDHPIGTDVNVDERFSIPPPALVVNAMTPAKVPSFEPWMT